MNIKFIFYFLSFLISFISAQKPCFEEGCKCLTSNTCNTGICKNGLCYSPKKINQLQGAYPYAVKYIKRVR